MTREKFDFSVIQANIKREQEQSKADIDKLKI